MSSNEGSSSSSEERCPYHGYNIFLDLGWKRDQAEESGEIELWCARIGNELDVIQKQAG